jgi:hypothetical protein
MFIKCQDDSIFQGMNRAMLSKERKIEQKQDYIKLFSRSAKLACRAPRRSVNKSIRRNPISSAGESSSESGDSDGGSDSPPGANCQTLSATTQFSTTFRNLKISFNLLSPSGVSSFVLGGEAA